MTIYELSQMIQCDIVIRYSTYCHDWYAELDHVEMKKGAFLHSGQGRGNTPTTALLNYVNEIKGETIVIDSYKDSRREYKVPSTLTV